MANVVYILRYRYYRESVWGWRTAGDRFRSREKLLEKLRMMKSQPDLYRNVYVTEIREWTPEEEEQYLSE